MDVYATADDLNDWLPTDASFDDVTLLDRYLKYATIVVGRACNRDLYSGDPEFPAPIVDATCAQAASWLALGTDPAKLGLDVAVVKKSSILGADVERDTAGRLMAFQEAVACLCPVSMDILLTQNLLWQATATGTIEDGLLDYGLSAAAWPRLTPATANSIDWPFQ